MSTPSNPLASFRSYSYYHVLVMCDSTETADNLSFVTNEEQWRHPTSSTVDAITWKQYHKYSPKSLHLTNQSSSVQGNYVVLIDGATDADVSILY